MKRIKILLAALLCAAAALAGCAQPVQETQETSLPAQQEVSPAPVEAKGTVTSITIITNEEGGYYVPIPDAWVGRTSYETDGSETYIYHITQDPSQPEINPILMHLGAAWDVDPQNLYPSAEVFLQMDEVKFFSVPVLDFPYVQGTADGNEYADFIESVPQMLQSAWVIDESKWQQHINPASQGEMFAPQDATAGGIQLGAQKDAALAAIGTGYLSEVETYELGATGETVEEYTFDFGTLTFTDGIFTGAAIYMAVAGPRGFSAGDNVSSIIASFCTEAEYADAQYQVYYRANTGDADITLAVPPSCTAYTENGGGRIVLSCFGSDDVLQQLGMDYLRESYIYETQYVCVFYFDESGVMTSFSLHYGALAE